MWFSQSFTILAKRSIAIVTPTKSRVERYTQVLIVEKHVSATYHSHSYTIFSATIKLLHKNVVDKELVLVVKTLNEEDTCLNSVEN